MGIEYALSPHATLPKSPGVHQLESFLNTVVLEVL